MASCRNCDRRRTRHRPADPLRGGQDRPRVRARRDLPPRPAAAAAEGPGPLPADPDRRPHGEGRPAHGDAERPAAGGDHEGQRARARQRGRVLPDRRAERRRSSRSRTTWSRRRRSRRRRCARCSASTSSTSSSPSATRSTRSCRRSSTRRPSPWGIKVSVVEVKDVEIPASMQRAMARQAEAERERRAKVISAEGEFQASERLKDAAAVMAQEPITVQLRYLQTLLEIGASNNSTIVFPIPIDLLTALSKPADAKPARSSERSALRRRLRAPRSACALRARERLRDLSVLVRADDRRERRDLLALAEPHHDHALRRRGRRA